jgi:glutaredoxin-related protein
VVVEYPCVVFMKGTPDAPQCGFSNATIKALNTVGMTLSLVRKKGLAVRCDQVCGS